MKKEWTEQDLREFVRSAQAAFEDVTLTEADEEAARSWQDDGLMVDYELRGGQGDCVLRRCVVADGKVWQLQMTAPLAGNDLPEDRMTPREREMCRDDMNHDFLSGVFNRRYFETEFCTRLDDWTDAHRCASLALVALDNADALRAGYGPVVMSQLVCFVANQWKKHFDQPAERVVCRLSDTLFAIGCADRTRRELEEELKAIYAEMPKECVASVGLMRRVPFTQSIGVAGTREVRCKNWDAHNALCEKRLAAAQTAGGQKAASGGVPAAKSGMEQVIDKGRSVVSTAVNGIANFAKSNAHDLLIVGVFLLLLLLVMSAFSSCSILFSGTTQVSGQTIYTAEDRDIRGAETDYKKLEKELDKKIKRTPTDHPGYDEYRYHLDAIEHDPWQLTSFLTTLYDDYTRSEVQAKLKETFAKQYKLTTWVEVQTRYRTVVMIDIFTGIPYTVQVPYEYRIFHTKLVNKGLEVVIREELDNDQWKRYEIFQDTLGGRPYLFKGGLPPGGSDGSGAPGIDYQVPAEALTDEEFAAIYKEAQKYVGTPYVWGGSTPDTGFDCSGYVCWVYNQNGYNVGRTTANGLWNKSQHISEAEAKPGDLVFFEGTYATPEKSHVGIVRPVRTIVEVEKGGCG